MRGRDLPEPLVNHPLGDHVPDFAWPAARLVVETDGAAHDRPRSRESDYVRDAELAVDGWQVIRVTHRRLDRDAGGLERQLRLLLAR